MLPLSDAAMAVLRGSHRRDVRAQSWLGDDLLADDIPITSGTEQGDRGASVSDRITLSVPRLDRGVSWDPRRDDQHPLAACGQVLSVQLAIETDQWEWYQRGTYLITQSQPQGDTVSVEAMSLLQLVAEAGLVSPMQPSGTIGSTLRSLVEPGLTVMISGLNDRAVPSGINWDGDRLSIVDSLMDAWAADRVVDPDGVLQVGPAVQSTVPVLSITDGVGGTTIRASGTSTRDDGYNCVVARGNAPDGGEVQGVAWVLSGPMRWGGPWSPYPVIYPYSSPLLTTPGQCQTAAITVLQRLARTTGRSWTVEMVPHPGVQLGDTLSQTVDGVTSLVSVEALSLPWRAAGGSQTLTTRELVLVG